MHMKHTFSKFLVADPNEEVLNVLLIGPYNADSVVAMAEATRRQMASVGIPLTANYIFVVLYLGPTYIPFGTLAVLPTGHFAFIFDVSSHRCDDMMPPGMAFLVGTYDALQVQLQCGMSKENAALYYWKMFTMKSVEMPEISEYLTCFRMFREEVIAIYNMLKELGWVPRGPSKSKHIQDSFSPERDM